MPICFLARGAANGILRSTVPSRRTVRLPSSNAATCRHTSAPGKGFEAPSPFPDLLVTWPNPTRTSVCPRRRKRMPRAMHIGPTRRSRMASPGQPRASPGAGPNPTDEGDAERDPLASPDPNPSLDGRVLPLIGGLALAATLVGVSVSQGFTPADALQRVEAAVANSGPAGPAIFIGAYAVATIALVPASVLTLAAGYLFGPVSGTAIVSAASTLGASLAFLVSRYAARPLVESRLARNPRFLQIDAGIGRDGARVVFLLRLSPLVPFSLLNYMLGLTSVPFWPYVGASWVGMLPGTVAYVGLGALGGAGVDAAGSGQADVFKLGLYAVGVVATLWATKIISGVASQALADGDPGNP